MRIHDKKLQQLPDRLPIFRVAPPMVDIQRLHEVAGCLFGTEEYSITRCGPRTILRSGERVVETNRNSGGIWAADNAQLWNPACDPKLPRDDEARSMGEELLRSRGLLPKLASSQPFELVPTGLGRTLMAVHEEGQKQRDTRQLDVQVHYGVHAKLGHRDLPLIGGGGKVSLTLGDQGKVIGFQSVWRDIEDAAMESQMIPPVVSYEAYKKLVRGMKVTDVEIELAYYAAPMRARQEFLYPVYVYRASAKFGDEIVPLRVVTLPATKFGPFTKPQQPQPARPPCMPPGLPKRGTSALDLPLAQPARRSLRSSNPFEAGISYIGVSGGLSGSKKNAEGFLDGLAADGWKRNFNWGDANAWESDWRRNDDVWVDAADFVFYTGHANMNGWMLSNPDDGSLNFGEVGAAPENPGDLWGQQDLEWLIVAACGPLQDDLIGAGGGNVLTRWGGAFDGLHLLLGYGGITYDNEEEGETVIEYATGGDTLINAWFRAAREIQPSSNEASPPDGPDIWVGAMYVAKSGQTSPAGDHLWGHGSVAPDPKSPNIRVCMWTTT